MVNDSGIEVGNCRLTNRSVRKRLATTMSKIGEGTATMMRQLGHSNASSLANYDTPDDSTTDKVTKLLYGLPATQNPSLSNNNLGPLHASDNHQQTLVEARGVKRPAAVIELNPRTDSSKVQKVVSDLLHTSGQNNSMSIATVNVYQYSHGPNL